MGPPYLVGGLGHQKTSGCECNTRPALGGAGFALAPRRLMRPFGRLRINASPRSDLISLVSAPSTCLPSSAWNEAYVTTLRAHKEWCGRPSVVTKGGEILGMDGEGVALP